MFLQEVTSREAQPRYLLNGFPKAGLHLLALMLAPVCDPPKGMPWEKETWWSALYNIWTLTWKDDRDMRGQFWRMARLKPGQYFKAHVPWRQDIADFIDNAGVAHVFIRRDLRDVAVSLTHHILDHNGVKFRHTDKPLYMLMGFDAALMAVIEGIGPYAGVVERWQQYVPWLDQERTLCMRFEDVVIHREEAARDMLLFGLNRINDGFDIHWKIDPARFAYAVEEMTKLSYETHRSPTFRSGVTGGWREAFTQEHIEAFKRTGGCEAMAAMGYEEEW